MKNIRGNHAGKEWGNVIKCYCQPSLIMLRSLENKRLTRIHRLKKQIGHERLFRPSLFLLFRIDDLFGEVTFTFTDNDRVVAIHAKVSDNVFLPQFVIQVYQRDNPCFDKHQECKAQGDPLFSGSFQGIKCGLKHLMNVPQSYYPIPGITNRPSFILPFLPVKKTQKIFPPIFCTN